MRSRSIALFSTLILGMASHGQSAGLGIKGGPLVSTVKAFQVRTTPIAGAAAGLYVAWGVGPRIEIQPEFLVSMQGATYTEPDGDDHTIRSTYLQVPLSVKLYLSNGFNLSGGYLFGKPLAAVRAEGSDRTRTDVLDRFENLDMGFVFGVGMDLQSGIDFSIRGYRAMTPSLRNDDALFPKNRSLEFTLGYRFLKLKASRRGRRRS